MDRLTGSRDDIVSGAVLLALALLYGASALRLPAGGEDPGPGFLPLVLAACLAGLSGWILVRGLRGLSGEPMGAGPGSRGPRPWIAIGLTLAYAVAFQPLGFVVATLGYTAGVAALFTRSRRGILLVPPTVTILLYLFFRVALGVRLPAGVLA